MTVTLNLSSPPNFVLENALEAVDRSLEEGWLVGCAALVASAFELAVSDGEQTLFSSVETC